MRYPNKYYKIRIDILKKDLDRNRNCVSRCEKIYNFMNNYSTSVLIGLCVLGIILYLSIIFNNLLLFIFSVVSLMGTGAFMYYIEKFLEYKIEFYGKKISKLENEIVLLNLGIIP